MRKAVDSGEKETRSVSVLRPRLRTALPALAAGLLTMLVASCAVGPAANRADQLGRDTGTRQPEQSAVPQPFDDDASRRESAPPSPRPEPAPAEGSVTVAREIVLPQLRDACCLAVLPGGDLVVAERGSGVVYRVAATAGIAAQAGAISGVAMGEGAHRLVDLAVPPDPSGEEVVELFAYYVQSADAEISRHRYDPQAPEWEDPISWSGWTIADDLPASAGAGGVVVFGPDGTVHATTAAGDILRLESDGGVPEDNPEPGSLTYAREHDQVVGLAWDAAGRVWSTSAAGEVRAVVPGAPAGTEPELADLGEPVSGLVYEAGCLWTAGAEGLWRLPLDGTELVAAPQLLPAAGATPADLVPAGDGGLWVLTTDGRVLRVQVR